MWEPACGPGALARVLWASGRHVVATDLVDYGSPDQDAGGRDFLLERTAPAGVACIVTNPPYKRNLPARFAAHGLTLVPMVILLCPLSFLEAERRSELFDSGVLARVHVFRDRLPMLHRKDWSGPRLENSGKAFAWFVFERDHRGPPAIAWHTCRTVATPSPDSGRGRRLELSGSTSGQQRR